MVPDLLARTVVDHGIEQEVIGRFATLPLRIGAAAGIPTAQRVAAPPRWVPVAHVAGP
jgi:hypothetical protein